MSDNDNRLQKMFIYLSGYRQQIEYHTEELEKIEAKTLSLIAEILSEPLLDDALKVGVTYNDITYKKSKNCNALVTEKYQPTIFIHQLDKKA